MRTVSISRFSLLSLFVLGASVLPADDWRDWMWEKPIQLREGVSVRGYALEEPRTMKAYVIRIDLTTPGIWFTATERADGWGRRIDAVTNGSCLVETKLETTMDFMERRRCAGMNVEVAVNATPWLPFPAPKGVEFCDPVGWCVADGVEVSRPKRHEALFIVRKSGNAEIIAGIPKGGMDDIAFAVSGFDVIMTNGVDVAGLKPSIHPRTAFGLTPDRKTLVLLAVDGRQPGYSLGADMGNLCAILRGEGVSDAVNMDGGGSTSLVVFDRKNGRPLMINRHRNNEVRKNAVNFGIAFDGKEPSSEFGHSGAMYSSYEFAPFTDTPAPEGFKPFYLSHYGRHGSRRINGPCVSDTLKTFDKADAAGLLTDTGRQLYVEIRKIADAHDGMDGELTERGAQEHSRLARRMAARFPTVFKGQRRIRCRASTTPRVLMSMENFVMTLKDAVPDLEFDFTTGERYKQLLAKPYYAKKSEGVGKRLREIADLREKNLIDANGISERLFLKPFAVDDPLRFVRDLFVCASDFQCLSMELNGLDIYRFFRPEEITVLSRCFEAETHGGMANSEEFGDVFKRASVPLAMDVIERAESAIADDRVAADLRFGHDQGIWPLAGLFDLEGPGDRVPMDEAWKRCPAWKWSPMAANLQIVLYRNAQRETLVKILYNEREMSVRGLVPVNGVYYRWKDFAEKVKAKAISNSKRRTNDETT